MTIDAEVIRDIKSKIVDLRSIRDDGYGLTEYGRGRLDGLEWAAKAMGLNRHRWGGRYD